MHALYNQMIEAMRKAKSLSYVSHYGWEPGTEGCTYRMWLKKPNYFCAETECTLPNKKTHKKEEAGGVLIGDGNTAWTYWPHGRPRFTSGYRPLDSDAVYEKTGLNSDMKEPTPPGGHSIWHMMCLLGGMGFPVLEPSTFHGYTDCLQEYVDGVRSLGTERIGSEECDKIEVSIMKHQRSWYLSLSRQDHLPRKLKAITRVSHDIVTNEQWSSVTINGDIPNTMFAWKPPKGWKEWRLPETGDRLLKPGVKAPDFEMASLDGKRIKLSDYRGRLVWLCIWRIGCPPCREEIPHLQEMYAKYKDQGLVVLGLNPADDRKLTVEFLRERGVAFPNILDPSEAARKALARDYGHGGAVPTNYLIDRDGKIAEVLLGYGGDGDPKPMAALQKTGGELGKAIRQEWDARASQSAQAVTAARSGSSECFVPSITNIFRAATGRTFPSRTTWTTWSTTIALAG